MKLLGIICALESELSPVLRNMEVKETVKKAGMTFHSGRIGSTDIVGVICGVGKVNAAVCAEILIEIFGCTHIINVGIAGGLKEDIYPLDFVLSTELIQHDVDATAFGERKGQIPNLDTFSFKADEKIVADLLDISSKSGIRMHQGIIVSGDQFIADAEKCRRLISDFDASACEMEGAAVAQVCYLNRIPFAVLRSISDNANNNAHMDYSDFKHAASEITWNILKSFIEKFGKNK